MNRHWGYLLFALLIGAGSPAKAGTTCSESHPGPQALATAAQSALRVQAALDAENAPVALVARAGTDLGKYGLHYSHVGFVVRDHPDGRWTVVHLLNQCGTAHSSLYAQGLVNFFADGLVSQDTRIVWLSPEFAQHLATVLVGSKALDLHDPDYNVIARYDSQNMQNSTAWVLDLLTAARLPASTPATRARAQAMASAEGHEPDHIHIPYSQRVLGGLFSANANFTDHPVAARLSGDYRVVTVRSILRYLETIGAQRRTREWINGVERATPGPA